MNRAGRPASTQILLFSGKPQIVAVKIKQEIFFTYNWTMQRKSKI